MATIYLDSSAINWLADDANATSIISRFKAAGHRAHTSCLNILELASTGDAVRRTLLLNVTREITQDFYPIVWPGEMLKVSLRAHVDGKEEMDVSVDPRAGGVWAVLRHPELVDEVVRLRALQEKETHEKWFRVQHQQARQALNIEEKPRVYKPGHFISPAGKDSAFLNSYFRNIILAAGGDPITVQAAELLEKVGAWRGYFTALALDHYNRAARAERFGSAWNPGGIDIQQAIYLAGCDIFISADKLQRRFMRNVCRIAAIKVPIFDYPEINTLLS
jgi:hypothetical protein